MQKLTLPAYGKGCFADLPPPFNIVSLAPRFLTGSLPIGVICFQRYDRVITILADGFGWRFFERHQQNPALQRFLRQGKALRWTSQFPSTTAAHITCIHTGLTPGESGVHEWQYYEPAVDAMITPLLFSLVSTPARSAQKFTDAHRARSTQRRIQSTRRWRRQVCKAISTAQREFTPSTYSDWLNRGATGYGYQSIAEAFVNLRLRLEQTVDPAYFYLYFPESTRWGMSMDPTRRNLTPKLSCFSTVWKR